MRIKHVFATRPPRPHALLTFLLASIPVIAIGTAVPPGNASSQSKSSSTEHYKKNYKFVSDWFTPEIPVWNEILKPYKGKPNLNYLEVGTFQGRSLLWVLENVATHPTSRLTGIDIAINEIFLSNIELSGAADRVTTLEGRSDKMLRPLPADSFDIIYIDGSHRGDDVLSDAVLSWPLLRTGGIMIFDDYLWEMRFPNDLRPKLALDTFITLYRSKLRVVHRGSQLAVEKMETPCVIPHPPMGPERFCTPIGDFIYDWDWKKILDPRTGEEVEITEGEAAAAEKLLLSIPIGQTRVFAGPGLRRNRNVISLSKKLHLDVSPPADH